MSLSLLILIIALLLSAFFSGMEIAFVSSSKLRHEVYRADNTGGISSRLLDIFYRHPESYISTMLVGNNIVLVIFSIMMSRLLDPLFTRLIPTITETPLLLLDTLVGTLVVLLFGEFLPKTLFRMNANATLRAFAVPTILFYYLLYPISLLCTSLSRALLRLFGVRLPRHKQAAAFTRMDLDDLIETSIASADDDDVSPEVQMFQNALDFSSLRVRDCMVPRNELAAVDKDCTRDELLHLFIETGFSKIIVYVDSIDNIIGYVHSSDLFGAPAEPLARLRSMPVVPEAANAQKLMRTLMQQKKSMAIVVDEFGGTAGIVSLEDIVEELTGDIEDEHDRRRYVARQNGPDTYVLSARLEIDKVNELFDLHLPTSDDYTTISGLILHHYQSFPATGQTVVLPGGLEFKILTSTQNKITLVRLTVK